MPLEFDDPDGDGVMRPSAERLGAVKPSWWKPASTAGRMFLALATFLVLGGFAAAGLLLAHFLKQDVRFRIAGTSNIQATGITEVSRADLLSVFGEDVSKNIFHVPLRDRRRELEQIPWIEHATVMRVLPDQIRVAVVERRPVAFTQHGQQIGLVDANGVLLSMSPKTMAERHYSFPVLTGIDPGDSAGARKKRMDVYMRLMAELDAGGKHNSEQVSEIDLTDPEDARVLMPEQGSDILVHLGERRFLERFERYKANIDAWRQRFPHLKSVDLRFDDDRNWPILQMASGAETQEGAAGDAGAHGDASAKPDKTAAKKNKPSPAKKHAAPKRTTTNSGRRNPATTSGAASAGAGDK